MDVSAFLDATYAMVIADLERAGLDTQSAVFKANEFLRFDQPENGGAPEPSVSSSQATAAQNDAALAELRQMLGGIT